MVVTTVMVNVKENHIQDFIQATIKNHEASGKEHGNMRFDILQSRNDPSSFLMYEAYDSEQSATAHKETEHYKVWRQSVEPWMARPREGIKYVAIRPL